MGSAAVSDRTRRGNKAATNLHCLLLLLPPPPPPSLPTITGDWFVLGAQDAQEGRGHQVAAGQSFNAALTTMSLAESDPTPTLSLTLTPSLGGAHDF